MQYILPRYKFDVLGTPHATDTTRNPEEPIPPDISLVFDHIWTEPPMIRKHREAATKVFLSRLVRIYYLTTSANPVPENHNLTVIF